MTATLYLPPGYDKEKDGPLPCLIWAYPREFKSKDAAGQATTACVLSYSLLIFYSWSSLYPALGTLFYLRSTAFEGATGELLQLQPQTGCCKHILAGHMGNPEA